MKATADRNLFDYIILATTKKQSNQFALSSRTELPIKTVSISFYSILVEKTNSAALSEHRILNTGYKYATVADHNTILSFISFCGLWILPLAKLIA